ncbi:major facilitator superfamily domain-containing protein [Pseudomassariella vexata]|uniref:Major facilitator superfamily domain-containing protein n=1 Tax=Pseudomassariella vexata TaxID=1141098 RepID=A0A1Y2E1P9_9PEZI|nr:major facilitator superfamily domain-containing protein [Pseudomassariella vexata]ORY65460.1 major facilitator superfamily domain-containing protein [Pseudomassariella vexata]
MRGRGYEAAENDENEYEVVLSHGGDDSDTQSVDTEEGVVLSYEDEVDDQDVALVTSGSGLADVEAGAGTAEGNGSTRGGSNSVKKQKDVAWRDLPKKKQLVLITLTRLSEPLVQTSLQSYMFYLLKWFDPELSDSIISRQAGILQASFTAAQFFTAMIWGRVADSNWAGRKTVILIGLLGTMISCIGFGFSTSFYQALFFRCLGGATNGNVGVLRTMISEIVREKKYQSRAFVLLPMTFNIGIIVGPILGGILSDPAGSYPETFGNSTFFQKFPYALPNIVSAVFLSVALMGVWLFLEETHDALRDRRDYGRTLAKKLGVLFSRQHNTVNYTPLHSRNKSTDTELLPMSPEDHQLSQKYPPRCRYTTRLPFRRIFTRNVCLTFFAHFFLASHLGTFNSLWFVFLSTPVYNPAKPDPPGFHPTLPFRFTGGLGLPPRFVGIAMALLGAIGITMQLFLYPRLSARLGTVLSWRLCLCLFPLAYTFIPYLAIVPSTTEPPSQKTGPLIWVALAGVLFIQVTGRTFALPAQTILVNNCTPHLSVLGTVHGLAQSLSSFARTVGPVAGGFLYGLGLSHGLVGGVFWAMAGVAVCGLVASFWVKEGNGHEIWLEGDEDDENSNG